MSVIGIDFGNESCYVAVARSGGIETVDNDYSLRATPSCVAFGERQRILGVAAKSQAVTNLKNTIFGFKRLLGRRFDDPLIQAGIKMAPFKVAPLANGRAGIRVAYLGEEQIYSPEQVTAMLFTKLKETAENAIYTKVHDCVISVPSYFTDAERRALLDAAQIAGLNVLRLLNETAAVALNYGIYKQDLPELDENPRNVVIVDCGHSAIQVTITAFNKGKLTVLACVSDPYLGGRNFDTSLAGYFCTEFQSKYGIDPQNNPRAYMRLLAEVEKLKKQMSANATKLPLNIECFMDEKDVTSTMCRQDFEQMCSGLFLRVEHVLQKCLEDSKLSVSNIHSVEIVGGSTRIPAIKLLIERVFKKTPSTTLNQDEAVARGCALQCAILSPAFKVRDFSISDVQPYRIKLVWDETLGEDGEAEIFPLYHPFPFSRSLTFYRKESLNLKAVYTDSLPYPTNEIGKFAINFKNDDAEPCKLKVKARLNLNGIFSITGATIYEKVEREESLDEPMGTESSVGNDNAAAAASLEDSQSESISNKQVDGTENSESVADMSIDEADNEKPKKVVYQARDLAVESSTFGFTSSELDEKRMLEMHMISRDRNEKERLDNRNALEEYVYDLRDKLESDLTEFVEHTEKEMLCKTLGTLENWLYEDGIDEKKEVYIEKLLDLRNKAEPIKERKFESERRPQAIHELERAQQLARKVVDLYNRKDLKYDHIPLSEMDKVVSIIKDSEAWLDSCRLKFGQNYQGHMPVPVKCKDILEQRINLESKVNAVINIPKPKVELPKEDKKATVEPSDIPQTNHNDENSQDSNKMDVE